MKNYIQRTIFSILSIENYLRLLQRSFFAMYNLGLLKGKEEYKYHYYAKNLIKEGDTVLDIGANLGYYSFLFSKWAGNTGKVYSVEPIALYNKIFNEKCKHRNNITLLPYALGTEEKEITLVSSSSAGYLRTGLPHVYDKQRDGDLGNQHFSFKAEMKVPSKLFSELDRIDYIKCDIEGFEYIVMSDMKPLLEKHKPIVQIEVWGDNEQPMIDLFSGMGYTPYKLDGKELSSDTKKIGGDYIFIHDKNK